MILLWLGCTQVFDISSSVWVTNVDGQTLSKQGVQFCHRLRTDYTSDEVKEYVVESCVNVDVENGYADLPNWEGNYRGEVTTIDLWLFENDVQTFGVLLDSDEDVWCDNVDEDTDMNGYTSYSGYCDSNFERFLVWSVILSE